MKYPCRPGPYPENILTSLFLLKTSAQFFSISTVSFIPFNYNGHLLTHYILNIPRCMINSAITNASLEIISHHSIAEVIQNNQTGQRSLHAVIPFKKEDIISPFSAGEIFSTPNYLTIQTGIETHITLVPDFLQYINHSCQPNVFFDTTRRELIALKDIEPHEELCFFYPSTELDMAQPFICFCGNKDCLQNIKGALHTPWHQLKNYRLSGFVQSQLNRTAQH